MGSRKSYDQFCALARSLDRIGERWTLLIVREMLIGPCTFRDLQNALDGVSPNLLVDRLDTLVTEELVERNDAPARSKAVTYQLTEAGAGLEPAVVELIRWGARYMATGPGDDRVNSRWGALALRALLNDATRRRQRNGVVHVDMAGTPLTIEIRNGARRVLAGLHGPAIATVCAPMPELLAVASGLRPRIAAKRARGDMSFLEVALMPWSNSSGRQSLMGNDRVPSST
jgi:DNA-binding HxlR family transcriptional regulator